MHAKNQAIEQLYQSRDFNEVIAKIEPAHLREDLKSEVILALLETPEAKIVALKNRNELRWYATRVIFNMVTNKYHPFYKAYRKPVNELSGFESVPDENDPDREVRELSEDIALLEIKNLLTDDCGLHWYDAEMLRLYIEKGSFRAMQKETQIPLKSCYDSVQRSFVKLKQRAVKKAEILKPVFTKEELRFINENTKTNS